METKTIMTIMEILLIGAGGMVIYFAYWVYTQIKKKEKYNFKYASTKAITETIIVGMGKDILADGCKAAVTPINTKTNDC